jgi:hypothetical protein
LGLESDPISRNSLSSSLTLILQLAQQVIRHFSHKSFLIPIKAVLFV